ncbi:pre-mRNA-splicing factor CWC25 [Echria macrotheca]|uniref:Pre-mRNA-splicing factor CWC25 n=1 Tax=Echria macrotheca TaxID=438768 RepID=A0AAJ0BK97_9PEZI|nr:pre-mRNA-splicing factor CWC25 [Echria macrotheca]
MGSGDLNMKKSWHPQRSGNVAATQKAEAEAIAERKKLQQRLQEIEEERRKEEIQKALEAAGGKRRVDRVEWMYSGPTDGQGGDSAENEAYLLGKRRIDKLLQDNEVKKLSKQPSQDVIATVPTIGNLRDVATKIREDPLLAIKRQEQQAYEAMMNDPIKRRQLLASMGIEDPNEKKRKEERREKHRGHHRSHREHRSGRDDERHSHRRRSDSRDRSRSPRRHRSRSPRRDRHSGRDRSRSPRRDRSRSPRTTDNADGPKRRRRDSSSDRRQGSRSRGDRDRKRRDSPSPKRYRSPSPDGRDRKSGGAVRLADVRSRYRDSKGTATSRSTSPLPKKDRSPVRDGLRPFERRGGQEKGFKPRRDYERDDKPRGFGGPLSNDTTANQEKLEQERARKLAAMQEAATDLDLDRERRLAAIEAAERARQEADDKIRQRNKKYGGDAGFTNSLFSRAADLKIADRVRAG